MRIEYLSCDICGFRGKNSMEHQHRELEVGGVPMNIWTPHYLLPASLELNTNLRGIARFKDYVPFEIRKEIVDKEGDTPLIELEKCLFLKDESKNPTQSFKDRGMVMLVSDALNSGKRKVAIPSTGNAAISLGYYANKAGLESIVFIPEDTPLSKKEQIERLSMVIYNKDLVKSYEHFFDFCKSDNLVYNGFPVTNLPYQQGVKTIAYEIFIQIGSVPDWVIIPIGSGGNIVAQSQGFRDLVDMGLTDKMPRFMAVQIEGADPITIGYQKGRYDKVTIIKNPIKSKAEAIASDTNFNYFKIMTILNRTHGEAVSVTDSEIHRVTSFNYLEFSSKSVFPALDHLLKKYRQVGTVVLLATARSKN